MALPQKSKKFYSPSFIIAVLLHIVILGMIFLSLDFSSNIKPTFSAQNTNPIQAVAVNSQEVKAEVEKLKQEKARKHQAEINKQRKLEKLAAQAREQRKLEQQKIVQLRKQQELELQQKKAEAEKLAQLKKQQEIAKADLKKLKEKQQAQAEAQKKQLAAKAAAAKKKQQLAKKQAAENDLQKELDSEEKAQSAAKAQTAAHNKQVENEVSHFMGLIQTSVENNWDKPATSQPDLHCKLLVQVTPGGQVTNVSLAQSSGDPALDRSAITAVYKAQPLPVPKDADLFDKYFRKFTITT